MVQRKSRPAKGTARPSPPERRFVNRDLSWIAFNARVLAEARNQSHPLLERVRFLSIAANNLDEFHMVHVAGLRRQIAAGVTRAQVDGSTPAESLADIRADIIRMQDSLQQVWADIRGQLMQAGIAAVERAALSVGDTAVLDDIFQREIFPLLTPLAFSPSHSFPFVPNRGLTVVARLAGRTGEFDVIVPVPPQMARFIHLPGPDIRVVAVEDAIQAHLAALFPNCTVIASGTMRVIRDSELPIEDLEMDDDAEHMLLSFETALQRSRHGAIVQLTLSASLPSELVTSLMGGLDISPDLGEPCAGLLGLAQVGELVREDRADLKFPPFAPRYPDGLRDFGGDCFAAIRAKEILVHHPYETFDVVVQFVRQAAVDPAVVAIKQTLYRTSENSPIVQALIEAAQAGKSVTVVVELKARFDEEANLKWARDLERAGAQVTYGFIDLKVHAKMSLVIRREAEGLASYIHYATGNYHPLTARAYTDLSLFSRDSGLCADAARLFNYMTGFAEPEPFERIAAAPLTLRGTLLDLIRAETDHARHGRPAAIWFKVNGLVDPEIIEALYAASSAGVPIRGIVRGICALRAGVPGLSETIRIHSLVGRFLEHARIVCFGNGFGLPSDQAKLFISSADWMPRNLDRRIETLIPIETDSLRRQIMDQIMTANLNDDIEAWELTPRDDWRHVKPGRNPFSAQDYFMASIGLSDRAGQAADIRFPPAQTLKQR